MLTDPGLITLSDEKVTLKPFRSRPIVERSILSDAELIANKGGTLIYDVELFKNYYFIGFKCHKTKKYFTLEAPFNERKLSWIMHNYRCIGFNNIRFDNPVLWLSYKTQDIPTLQRLANSLINENLWHQQAQKEFNFKIYDTSILDLIEIAPLKGSLKLYMARLHAPRLQELPFPINVNLTDEEKKVAKFYNYNDLDGTELLFDFMKERIELRSAMSSEYNLDLMSKSDAQIAEAVLVQEVTKLNGVRPKKLDIPPGFRFNYNPPAYIKFQTPALQQLLETVKSATFIIGESGRVTIPKELDTTVQVNKGEYRLGIGGLHSSEKCVSYKETENMSIVDRDVQSYYPKIVTNLSLFPRGMGLAFLDAYKNIIAARLDAKKKKQLTKDKGLKITINGAGGKFSDPYSMLYDPTLTIQMTVTGQLTLLLLIEILELSGIEVISANTDGIVMLVYKDKEETLTNCIDFWEKQTNFITEETRYAGYYARDCNSYIALVKEDGD